MRSTPLLGLVAAASASPMQRQVCDTANDWDSTTCAEVAVIFARGTFDSGNIGPWVGCPFRDALVDELGDKVAFQGVSPDDYPADLDGYIEDGGPAGCASSLGSAVDDYAARCPDTKFVVSGWSQGALCAHKSLDAGALTSEDARSRVVALTTFGDPISVWQDDMAFPELPAGAELLSYCEQSTPDPLCTNLLADFPSTPKAFVDKLKAVWNDFSTANLNAEQKRAIASLAVELPKQASSKIGKLGKDILAGHLRRWMLTPQHFLYGVGEQPMVRQAAKDIAALVQKAD